MSVIKINMPECNICAKKLKFISDSEIHLIAISNSCMFSGCIPIFRWNADVISNF
ncbi:MAG: hypothetical protein ACE5J9_08005 [Methanosarcinales archaeon]